jgi:hypothetical protein
MVDAMKKLTAELNEKVFTWKDAPKATCWMCHRGRFEFSSKIPQSADDEEEKAVDWGLEKKPEDKKPEDKKPEDKKPEDKKPEDKKPSKDEDF